MEITRTKRLHPLYQASLNNLERAAHAKAASSRACDKVPVGKGLWD